MPLSAEQIHLLDIFLRANTFMYERKFMINEIEQALDSSCNFSCDLFFPNCFIDGRKSSDFWFRVANIMCSDEGVTDWHELEFGEPLSSYDLRQRYIYTWIYKGDTYRFYTKKLDDGNYPELVWYIGKSINGSNGVECVPGVDEDDIDSMYDTDSEEIHTR
jgi:hypothetical protein